MPFFTGGKQADMGPMPTGTPVSAHWGGLRLVAELRIACRILR